MGVEYRAPRNEAELDDTLQCSGRAFGGHEGFFEHITKDDPWFRLENTRACFLDGKAVSVVQIFERSMRIGRCPVKMGGLGSVGTDPDHRRKGYGAGVLRDTVRYLRTEGFDLSMLGTGVPSHYFRAGWVQHPTHALRLELPEAVPEPTPVYEISVCDLERDLSALQSLYDAYNVERTGTVVRSADYWRAQPKWRRQEPDLFRVARRDGREAAYLKAGHWEVLELAHGPDDEAAASALLAWFLKVARSKGVTELQALLPRECARLLAALGCGVWAREHSGWMVRLVNTAPMLEKMQGMLSERLRRSDADEWAGTIRLRTEADSIGLRVGPGAVEVVRGAGGCDAEVAMSRDQLLRLVLGNVRAEAITFANHLSVPEPALAVLNAIFPRDELMLWRGDGF